MKTIFLPFFSLFVLKGLYAQHEEQKPLEVEHATDTHKGNSKLKYQLKNAIV